MARYVTRVGCCIDSVLIGLDSIAHRQTSVASSALSDRRRDGHVARTPGAITFLRN